MTPHQKRQQRREIESATVVEVWARGGDPDDIRESELDTALEMVDVPYVVAAVIRRQRQRRAARPVLL